MLKILGFMLIERGEMAGKYVLNFIMPLCFFMNLYGLVELGMNRTNTCYEVSDTTYDTIGFSDSTCFSKSNFTLLCLNVILYAHSAIITTGGNKE